jgi:hypothetical protein
LDDFLTFPMVMSHFALVRIHRWLGRVNAG